MTLSRSNWNLEMLVFEERKTGVPGEKPLGARLMSTLGIERGPSVTSVGGEC